MKEEVLKELLVTIKDTKSFVLEQAPGVAQEMIFIARIESSIILVGSLIAIFSFFFFQKKIKEDEDSYSEICFVYSILSVVSPTIGVIIFARFLSNLSCWFAPKYFLLKELSKLIGG